jgi:RsiW-degrading membrane proteinase PrsW (M82 family)
LNYVPEEAAAPARATSATAASVFGGTDDDTFPAANLKGNGPMYWPRPEPINRLGSPFDPTGADQLVETHANPFNDGSEEKAAPPPAAPVGSRADFLYWLLILTLIPLGHSLFTPPGDARERFEHTEHANPGIFGHYERQAEQAAENDEDPPPIGDLIERLPGGRIEGAFLARDTWWHWIYAGLATIGFLTISVLMFPRSATNPRDLLIIGGFTGTFGVFLLLAVQFISYFPVPIAGFGSIIFIVLRFINFSYRAAMDPNSSFILSFVGFTLGVGLCEELVKALPMVWYYRNCQTMSWRGACRWGLASGAGFGIAEGLMYSSDFYNGIETGEIYIVRFVSCVALHAIWSASVGIMLFKGQDQLQAANDWTEWVWPITRVLLAPMILHGLYDTLLKKELYEFALAVAVISFAWMAWQIETLREQERKAAQPPPEQPTAQPA